MFSRTPLSPEQQAAKNRAKEERAQANRERRARWEEQERERLDNLPHFVVQEIREVTVKASDLGSAITLAAAAFKEGQSSDHTIKWNKPFGVDGNTLDPIRTLNLRGYETK